MIIEIIRVNFGLLISLFALTILSYMDLKRKEVSLWALLVYGLMMIVNLLCLFFTKDKIDLKELILSLSFMLILIIMSLLFKAIAIADSITVGLVALTNGFLIALSSFFLAMLAAAVFSLIGLALKKLKRKATIPFIPFLLAGYLISTIAYFS
ncbi:hypothetical protein [Lachnospira multipara]|jgi:prepilin signal peptidase PulO-like enzyme (type II secretory pathway)|uniref:Leader peptidase (Prepilin peptidase) / N-methyltransferase n=1 Tax=Lachnospira multipara TaxID=28051 RepID=A0A1H5U337_9FIRM|nr:hypothetical protein [Lachnospira multipara]SEF68651.1 hypothetical protein SAMN05216537_10610 [Lachnospira multipara]